MPTLNWIGKEAVVEHHLRVPFRTLRDVPALACGAHDGGNLIVEGDNLAALKALLPEYAGLVKCVYIDPPYNTGNDNAGGRGWVYNDNVNSPSIREWLARAVGREGEDLSRHDKWLCMMYPRLALLRQLLRDDGLIFVSIDETEVAALLHLLDEIFGRGCRLAVFTWVRKKKGSNLSKELRKVTEYVVAYKRTDAKIELRGAPAYAEKMVPLVNRANQMSRLTFPAGRVFTGKGFADGRVAAGVKGAEKGELAVTLETEVEVEGGVVAGEFSLTGRFRWSQATVDEELERGSRFVLSRDFRVNVARYNQAEKFKAPASLLSPQEGVGTNEDATEELRAIFPEKDKLPFDYPKPTSLVEYLLRAATHSEKDALVLDSFAGSGTTAHAVLRLNRADGGRRRFILVELEPEIARAVTAERVRRVSEGYAGAGGERVEGLGGGFRFCELCEPPHGGGGAQASEGV
jgi:adenine-specific DNA-methyltransferase